MSVSETYILRIIILYIIILANIVILSNILRCYNLKILSKITILIFIVLVFPLSLLWFINHAILQLPSRYFITHKESLLSTSQIQVETLSMYMSKQINKNICRIPPLILVTLAPNIALTLIIVLVKNGISNEFTVLSGFMLVFSLLLYVLFYTVILRDHTDDCCEIMCIPVLSIWITIKSITTLLLYFMKIINIFGFRIFGLNEYNYDVYRHICHCTCNVFENEYNAYIKCLEWFINEREHVLYYYLNDGTVVDIIKEYLNDMEYEETKKYIIIDNSHLESLTLMNDYGFDCDKDVVINMFRLNDRYIKYYKATIKSNSN